MFTQTVDLLCQGYWEILGYHIIGVFFPLLLSADLWTSSEIKSKYYQAFCCYEFRKLKPIQHSQTEDVCTHAALEYILLVLRDKSRELKTRKTY